MDERQRRFGRNQAMFREANERIEDVNRAFAAVTDTFQIICECRDETCMEQLSVSVADYERVRADSTHFLLARGHENPEIGRAHV